MAEFDYTAKDDETAYEVIKTLSPWDAVALVLFVKNNGAIGQRASDSMVGKGLFVPRNVTKQYNELSPLGDNVASKLVWYCMR